jgi:hypothetical protein
VTIGLQARSPLIVSGLPHRFLSKLDTLPANERLCI